ncbi:sodium:solute symporter [bacterium]|nr:sodium:solute symporter [bacterium]
MDGIASSEMVMAGWTLVIVYVAVTLFFVIRGAMKTKTMADYAVGTIQFSPVAVGLALSASMTSAATFIINPGFIAMYGLSGVLSYAIALPVAAMVSLVILTKGFRHHGSTVKALTLSQWIGTRFKSSGYSLFFAFIALLLITFIVLICVGLTKVLSKTLNVDEWYILLGTVIFIFGYMMFGGANSMVYTNTVQSVIMLVVAFILLGSGYEHFKNGIQGFLDELTAIDPNLITWTNPSSPLFRDFFEIIFCQMVVGVAIVCQPHIITKSLLLKTDKDVNRYLVTGVISQMIFFFVVFAGLYARLTFPDLKANGVPLKMDGIIPAYVVTEFSVYVGLLVVLGLISAGISTLEGLIQSLSTTITSDIIQPLFGKYFPADESKKNTIQFTINKLVIAFIGFAAIFISYDQLVHPNLSVGIFAQNGVYAYFAAAFVPVLFGTFLKNVHKAAPIMASLTAVVTHFSVYYGGLTPYMQSPVKNPAISASMAILSSLAVGYVLYFVLRKKSDSKENI